MTEKMVEGSWLHEVKVLGLARGNKSEIGGTEGSKMERTVAQKTPFSYFFQPETS